MSENPFGNVDMGALLRQAQEMQQQLVDAQASLADESVEGSVAGGAVTVVLTGTGDLTDVRIASSALEGGTDADSLADLGDLIVAAWRDAKSASDRLAQQRLGPLAAAAGMGGAGADPFAEAFGDGAELPDLGGLGDLGDLFGGGEPPRA